MPVFDKKYVKRVALWQNKLYNSSYKNIFRKELINMEKYEKMKSFDPEVYAAIQDETNRQNNKIELIASENFVSERIMEANGSPLTNKYAEGYPGKRYYGGCQQ